MPHISVAIPAYNRAHLIGRTIESVLSQEFQDWDLLVVDDASADNTVEVVRQYCERDLRIQLMVNPQNLGLTRNWSHCLDLARGPLVEILQSDDLIDPDYLQKVSDAFDAHPSIGFVAASCRYIDINDLVISPGTEVETGLYRAGDEAVTSILAGHPHVSSIVVRRECYEHLGGYMEDIWHGPDVEMSTRLAAHYDYYRFGKCHTSFRRHGANIGCLEFLRDEYLPVYERKLRLSWGYLSSEGRRRLGVSDLDKYVASDTARTALSGAIMAVAYGRPRLARCYLREAIRRDARSLVRGQFWKAAALGIVPSLGKSIMQRRMKFTEADRELAVAEGSEG